MKDSRFSKKGTGSARMVWIRGKVPGRESVLRKLGVWVLCHIRERKVRVCGPRALIAEMANPADDRPFGSARVIVLRDFELLRGELATEWMTAVERLLNFADSTGIRVVLVSEGPVTPEVLRIHRFSPLMVRADSRQEEAFDADLMVHRILDDASRIAAVPIKRISEKAANFLEDSACSQKNDGLLELVVEGIRRSDGHTLRFRDLLPNFASYFDSEDPFETHCN